MKNLYLFFCIICLMLFGMANTPVNAFDFGSLKLNDRPHVLLSKVAVPTPKITASSTTICKGSKVTLTATACTNGVLKWTDGLEGNSITVSPAATKSYRVLCKLNSAPAGSPTMSDSSTAVKITVNPIPVAPKITSNTYCNNPVSVLGDISFGGDNTDYLSSTCIAKDGALVMIGYSASSNTGDKSQASKGGSDYWVVKVNASGTKVWDKTFGGTGDDAPTSIFPTSDGGFLISGYSNSPKSGDKSEASKGGYDYWLVKIDANGTKVWDKSFGGSGSDYATSIIATSDNNFLITGHSDSEIGGNKSVGTKGSLDYWIIKIKPDGTKLWDKSYGGSGVDNLVSVVSTKEGVFLLAGHSSSLAGGDKTESSKGNYDYWVLKIDANGAKIWDKSYGALSQEELSSITPTFDGGFILGGISNSKAGGDKTEPLMGGFDYWIVKIDGNGTKLWDKVFGGSDTEYFAKVLPTADGGCLLGGTSYSPISGNKFEASLNGDFWLVKISSNGSRTWDKVIGGNSADVLKEMFMGDNGKVILSGYSFSDIGINKSLPSRGSSDYWTVYAQVCDNSYKPYTNLVATGCTGVVTWSNNATGNTIAVSPAVSTNFTATCKLNGCLSSPSNVIAVSPAKPATPSIAASNTSICAGSSIVLSSSNSPNGIITWTGGLKGNSITISPTATKTYKSICSINGINSDSSNSITITVIPQPTQPKITASNSTICQGSSTTLTASACTEGILTWTGGLTGSSITVSPTATKSYKVLCTQNYCKSDSSVATTITVTTKPQAPLISSKANYTSNNANAQWNKTFGGVGEENLTSIVSCADGGALLGGYSTSNVSADKSESSKGVYDYWIIRIDAEGKKLWDKTLGGGNYDYLTSIVTTADGGFLLGGYSLSNKSGDKSENLKGDKDYWIVKIDKNGQKVWDKTFGGLYADVLTSIISTSDGGFLLGGHSLSYVGGDKTETNKGNNDYWVVKIDANGNKLWDKTFGGASYDYLYGMTTTSDGGFLLGGYSGSNKSGDKSENIKGWNDYWIVKIDAKGNKVWDKTIGGDGGDTFSSLINTSDGGFLLAGYSSSNQSGDKSANAKGNADYWIVKIDASGNKLWDKTFGGNSLDQLNAVFKTSDGGFLLGGYSQSSINGDKTENTKGNYDYWVVRIDALGNKLWDKTIGGNDNDQFSSMMLMKDGSFLLGGNSNSKASYDKSENAKGGFDYWLIKIKENQIKSTTSLTATGCTGTVNWSNGATGSSITVSPTVAITYTATCTVNTCKSAASNAITVTGSATKPNTPTIIANNTTTCSGVGVMLSASACASGMLTWTGGLTGNSITVNLDKTKSYRVVCNQNGINSDSSTAVTINVLAKPTQPKITASNSTICSGSSVTLTSTACTGGTLTWTGGATGSSITVSPSVTKSYKVLCSQGTCKSDSSAATIITVTPKPTQPKITASNSAICAGSSTILTSTACTGGTLTWTGGATGSSITVSPTATKSYKVLCTQGTCKSDSSLATTITVVAKPTQPKITASNSTICSGGSTVLTSTACTGGTLTWTGGLTGSSITVSPTATKSYKVLCTQGTCKSDSSAATIITVTPKPTQPKITASNSAICAGSSTTLTSTACTGGVLTWTGGATGSSITVSPTASKSYKVLCTQGTCKSDSSLATTITVLPKPTQPKITASNSTICAGSSVTLTSTACTGGTLTWTGGATGSSITVSPTATKSYKVLCTQGACKSDSSVAVTINVIAKPSAPTITKSLNNSVVKQWDKTIGGNDDENLKIIVATQDGGFIFGGDSNSGVSGEKTQVNKGGQDYWVVKTDANGNKLWDKTFGGSSEDNLQSIVATNGGGFILGGYSQSGISGDKTQANKGESDYWIIKIDANGNKIWDKSFGGNNQDNLQSIVASNDGGFILGGDSWYGSLSGDKTQNSRGTVDYWIVKIDANGNKLWDKSFGGDLLDNLQSMVALKDGGFLLGGNSYSGISGEKTQNTRGVNDYDYWVVRIDANGNKLWDKTLGGISNDYLQSIVVTNDSGFILGGYTFSGISGDKTQSSRGAYDYWIVKIDATGNKVWDKTFGGNGFEYLESIIPSKNGGFILGGYSGSGISGDKTEASKIGDDYWLVKIDANGNKLWDKAFGGDNFEYLRSAVSINDSEFIIGGSSESNISGDKTQDSRSAYGKGSFSWDYWILKIKENQSTTLTATGCIGTVNWSNGATTNSITVSPTVATTYTATCTVNTCKSANSNAITVSPDVVPNGRIEVDVAIQPEPSFNFKVFPNPAKDELTIQTDLEGEATFHLYNNIGQRVLEKTFEKQTKIDLKNLSKGSHIYLIQHDKTQTSGKVLLE